MKNSFITLFLIALCVLRSEAGLFVLPSTVLNICTSTGLPLCDLSSPLLAIFGLGNLPGINDDVILNGTGNLFFSISNAIAWKSLIINGSATSTTQLNIAGALTLASASTVGAFSTLTVAAGGTIRASSSLLVDVGATLNVAAGTTVSVAQMLTIAGTASFSGVCNATGGLTLQASAVVTFTGSASSNVTGQITSSAGALLSIDANHNVTSSNGAALSGTTVVNGNFFCQGTSSFTVTGTSATAFAILKGAGSITGNVYMGANANISAGNSPGTVFVRGDLHLDSTSTVLVEAESATSYDKIAVFGTAYINGILAAKFINGYDPVDLQNFPGILTYTSKQGEFNVRVAHDKYFFISHIDVTYNSLSTDMKFVDNSGSSFLLGVLLMIVLVLAM
jgi:hypothetical protein